MFLATGKHDLRGARGAARGTGLVGLKMYYSLAPRQQEALRHHVELVLFAGGYAGLQLVESDKAVLVHTGARGQIARRGMASWDKLLDSLTHECPHLADRLAGAPPLLRPAAGGRRPTLRLHARTRCR